MGMFDYLRCQYPLPVAGANELEYQTKDTDAQFLDSYEIRADGTLWHKTYTTEDRSDPNADPKSLLSLMGCMTRVNDQWEPEPHTGAIEFYTDDHPKGWIEFCAVFKNGALQHLMVVSDPLANTKDQP